MGTKSPTKVQSAMQEQLGLPLVRKPSTGGAKVAIRKTISRIDREGVVTDSRIEVGSLVHTMSGEQISMLTLCFRWFSQKLRTIDDPLELDFFHFLVLDPFSLAFNHSCDPNCGF